MWSTSPVTRSAASLARSLAIDVVLERLRRENRILVELREMLKNAAAFSAAANRHRTRATIWLRPAAHSAPSNAVGLITSTA